MTLETVHLMAVFPDDTNVFLHGKSLEGTINKATNSLLYHISVLGFVLIN